MPTRRRAVGRRYDAASMPKANVNLTELRALVEKHRVLLDYLAAK